MTEHTRTDGLPGESEPQVLERARPRNERMADSKIECNACPVLCQITEGRSGQRQSPLPEAEHRKDRNNKLASWNE